MPVDGMWEYMYSICVFLQWIRLLRVLSVSRRLGPLVILVIRMGQDISKFAVVYFLFLIAFSILIRGSMPGEYYAQCPLFDNSSEDGFRRKTAASDASGDELEVETPAKCWSAWFIIRTFLQAAWGELFIEDMRTDAAVLGLAVLWVVMNLLLYVCLDPELALAGRQHGGCTDVLCEGGRSPTGLQSCLSERQGAGP